MNKTTYNKKVEMLNKKTLSKSEIQALNKMLNNIRFDDDNTSIELKEQLKGLVLGCKYNITTEHTKQGIDFLNKFFFDSRGCLRNTAPIREIGDCSIIVGILKDFERFEFTGFEKELVCYDTVEIFHRVFKVIDKKGNWFEYTYSFGNTKFVLVDYNINN